MMNETIDIAESENKATAPGLHDNEDLINEIVENLREGRRHFANWRTEARDCYDFYAGTQWSQEDAAKLEEEERPVVTFNRIPRTINAVTGLELQNRQEVRFIPRENSDTGVNELLTDASKWVRDNCDAEDEESEAFEDQLICGMGWTETRMDYEDNPEGEIKIDRFDPLEGLADPRATKKNYSDARWMARIREFSKKEIEERWPDADIEPSQFWNDLEGNPHDATDAYKYENDQSDKLAKPKTFSVAQYQWWERVTYYKVMSQTGQVLELDTDKFEKLQPYIQASQLRYVRLKKRVFKQMFLIGRKQLEVMDLGCPHFTLKCITGIRDRNNNTWFGLVALMKDPQRWANKWLSQVQHIVNTGAKNGLIAEQDAITNPRKLEDEWAKPGSISYVAPGAISQGKIKEKQQPQYPDGVDRLLQYAISAINDVVGVSLEMLGMTNRDQAGYLEELRKTAGLVILAKFFDSLRKYRKEQGRVLAYFIKEYISDGRLIRVSGPTGAQYIPLLRDKLTLEYDVIVDDAPTSPNMKERTFGILNSIIPLCLEAGIPIPPEVLDYAPIPEMLAQQWKKLIAGSQQPDPFAEQLKQLQLILMQLEAQDKQVDIQKKAQDIQKGQSEMVLNYAKAEQAHATGQDESAQAAQKMGLAQQETQNKTRQMLIEQARKYVEMIMTQQRKREEAQMNARIKAQQARTRPMQ
jgi:hypothetical protein